MFAGIIFSVFFVPFCLPYFFAEMLEEHEIDGKKCFWWQSLILTILFILHFIISIYCLDYMKLIKDYNGMIFIGLYAIFPLITLLFSICVNKKEVKKIYSNAWNVGYFKFFTLFVCGIYNNGI